jgi:hypothetical protein
MIDDTCISRSVIEEPRNPNDVLTKKKAVWAWSKLRFDTPKADDDDNRFADNDKMWGMKSRPTGTIKSLIGEPSLRGHRWFTTGVEEDVRPEKSTRLFFGTYILIASHR